MFRPDPRHATLLLLAALGAGSATSAQNTTRVSVTAAGAQVIGHSEAPDLSHTGRFVTFYSQAPGLVPVDVTAEEDVFVVDRYKGTIERASVSTAGVEGNSDSREPTISADGRLVAFLSFATNLDPLDQGIASDIYLRNRVTGTTSLVTVTSAGAHPDFGASLHPEISANGRFVVFDSAAKFVVEDNGAVDDVYLRDLLLGTTIRVNLRPDGGPSNSAGIRPGISGDGRFICYESTDPMLVPGDTNSTADVFVRDMLGPGVLTVRASVAFDGSQGNDTSDDATISDDGTAVAFVSRATNLVPGDTNGARDIFVRDFAAGTTTRVSVSTAGVAGNGNSLEPEISADGRYVSFRSLATNLVTGDTNGQIDDFLHDRVTGITTRISISTAGVQSDKSSSLSAISGDGRYAAFDSNGTNLVAGDTNGSNDIFLRNLFGCPGAGSASGYGAGLAGAGGFTPAIGAEGCPLPGALISLRVEDVVGGAPGALFIGASSVALPFKGGTLHVGSLIPLLNIFVGGTPGTPGAGSLELGLPLPADPLLSGLTFFMQAGFADSAAPAHVSLTRGLAITVG